MARDTSPKGIKKHQRYMRRKLIRQNWDLYLLVAIPVLSLIIFNYIPMFGIVIAFQDYKVFKGIAGSKWVGLAQFTKLFTSAKFFELLRNTILITSTSSSISSRSRSSWRLSLIHIEMCIRDRSRTWSTCRTSSPRSCSSAYSIR